MKLTSILAPAAALVVLMISSAASAQGKGPLACGQRAIPLQVGNYWVYAPVGGTTTDRITLKVVEVGPSKDPKDGKGTTTIKVDETYKGRTVSAIWRCNANGLTIPPDSFLFAGEPGGGVGVVLTTTAHEAVTITPDEALVPEKPWIEMLKADAERQPAAGEKLVHTPAKIELERHCLVKGNEEVIGQIGQWTALKFTFELRGRAFVENEKWDIPIKRPGAVWLVKGLGVVKIDDAFERTWDLVESSFSAQKIP